MEPKRTNSPIDFLRSLIQVALLLRMREKQLTGYWCLPSGKQPVYLKRLILITRVRVDIEYRCK